MNGYMKYLKTLMIEILRIEEKIVTEQIVNILKSVVGIIINIEKNLHCKIYWKELKSLIRTNLKED